MYYNTAYAVTLGSLTMDARQWLKGMQHGDVYWRHPTTRAPLAVDDIRKIVDTVRRGEEARKVKRFGARITRKATLDRKWQELLDGLIARYLAWKQRENLRRS